MPQGKSLKEIILENRSHSQEDLRIALKQAGSFYRNSIDIEYPEEWGYSSKPSDYNLKDFNIALYRNQVKDKKPIELMVLDLKGDVYELIPRAPGTITSSNSQYNRLEKISEEDKEKIQKEVSNLEGEVKLITGVIPCKYNLERFQIGVIGVVIKYNKGVSAEDEKSIYPRRDLKRDDIIPFELIDGNTKIESGVVGGSKDDGGAGGGAGAGGGGGSGGGSCEKNKLVVFAKLDGIDVIIEKDDRGRYKMYKDINLYKDIN